ncbi:MAG: hypothetical protein HYV60_21530, partial [Planctomycetia bacterium]|nr:hypothetical protein [Planctomycetia bacterium]
ILSYTYQEVNELDPRAKAKMLLDLEKRAKELHDIELELLARYDQQPPKPGDFDPTWKRTEIGSKKYWWPQVDAERPSMDRRGWIDRSKLP